MIGHRAVALAPDLAPTIAAGDARPTREGPLTPTRKASPLRTDASGTGWRTCSASTRDGRYRIPEMVFEKPIIDKHELMQALDPVHRRGEVEFERLTNAKLLSRGVKTDANRPHTHIGGTLYCSLNRDAISAIRHGHVETAGEIRNHAERIEADMIAPWLELVGEASNVDDEIALELDSEERAEQKWMRRVLTVVDEAHEGEVGQAIWEAAQEVAEVRAQYEGLGISHVTIARVWRINEEFSELTRGTGFRADVRLLH